LLGLPPLRWLF